MKASSSKQFEVLLTAGAQRDIEFIHDYIFDHDRHANANPVLDGLLNAVDGRRDMQTVLAERLLTA